MPVKTIKCDNGNVIKIYPEKYPTNPREEFDHFGHMYCSHRRYSLGDKHTYDSEIISAMAQDRDTIALPLYLMDHSGLTLRTTTEEFRAVDTAGWDWGLVGYILVTKREIRAEYNCKLVTKKIRDKVLELLRAEVEEYGHYLAGEVYGFVVEDSRGNRIDSCWGFYGMDAVLADVKGVDGCGNCADGCENCAVSCGS
jgi:hypothetical protein